MIRDYAFAVVLVFASAGLAAADRPQDGAETLEAVREKLTDDPTNAAALKST